MVKAALSLNFMHCMERFATQIYLTQRGAFKDSQVVQKLEAASENEASHVKRLKAQIRRCGWPVIPAGWLFQVTGVIVGNITRLLGRRRLLLTDISVENRAIRDYGGFLERVHFDPDTVHLIQKIISEEQYHVQTWQNLYHALRPDNSNSAPRASS